MIPFNKPYLHGRELVYIAQAVAVGKISGDGLFSKKCHSFFKEKYGFNDTLLTTSCTDALEMAALLLDIQAGDEVIMPSFTFVSTANAFALRGASIVFADSCPDHPNIDPGSIESLITDKTKAVVVVHYAGMSCDMNRIKLICDRHNLHLVEDAAQAIDSTYFGKPLGSFGTFGTLSFHETKNIISGEGGLLIVNDPKFMGKAEIVREKGTNRSAFFRGEIDKYNWVSLGSSFLPSDIIAAYLFAQLEVLDNIQSKRIHVWNRYYERLSELELQGKLLLPIVPEGASNNGHIFYMVCKNLEERSALIKHLSDSGIYAVFHYSALHNSPHYLKNHSQKYLVNAEKFSDTLVRLPIFYELTDAQVDFICDAVISFFNR